jgi:hypothetical protein
MDGIFVSQETGNQGWISLVSLAVALAAVIWTAYWNRRSERRGYLDEYWFRQIVAPKCINPILGFHDAWLARVDSLNRNKVNQASVQSLLSDFQKEKSVVLNSTWVARIFSTGFYARCCELLDAAEDTFAIELGAVLVSRQVLSQAQASMKVSLADASVGILQEAAKIHGGALRPRDSR